MSMQQTSSRGGEAGESFGEGLAVITGAGSGLGAGFARHAAVLGMRVLVADIDTEAAAGVAAAIRADGGEAWAAHVDVRDASSVEELARDAYAHGDVRLLINNAGVEQLGYLWDTPLENWRRIVDINITGVFHGIRAFVPRMIAAGAPAHIWNVASVGAVTTIPWQAPYLTTKQAVLGMTESLKVDLDAEGSDIRVGVVMPASVTSRIFDSAGLVDAADADAAAVADAALQEMRGLLPTAMDPRDAARTVFEQAARGEFYLLPQEDFVTRIMKMRGEQLAARRAPRARAVGTAD